MIDVGFNKQFDADSIYKEGLVDDDNMSRYGQSEYGGMSNLGGDTNKLSQPPTLLKRPSQFRSEKQQTA